MKKVGKTTRPFRYDPNHIPNTVELMNRFKGLYLVEFLKNCGQRFVTSHPKEKEMQEGKVIV